MIKLTAQLEDQTLILSTDKDDKVYAVDTMEEAYKISKEYPIGTQFTVETYKAYSERLSRH